MRYHENHILKIHQNMTLMNPSLVKLSPGFQGKEFSKAGLENSPSVPVTDHVKFINHHQP